MVNNKKLKIANILFTILVSAIFIVLAITLFQSSYLRTNEALTDLFNSVKYYISKIFNVNIDADITANNDSNIIDGEVNLPDTPDGFKQDVIDYFKVFASKENFVNWGHKTAKDVQFGSRIMMMAVPIVFILAMIIRRIYLTPNNLHGVDTLPLKVFKKISQYTYRPIKFFLMQYIEFLKTYDFIYYAWGIIWALNLNLVSIILGFLAYYFYFAVSFDLLHIYKQVIKLFVDLQIAFTTIPIIVYLILGLWLFDRARRNRADNRLRRLELKNRDFIDDLPIVSMTVGSMGKKKTTMITDMAISQEIMFRDKAYEKLRNIDMKFPYFPWILFEQDLKTCMEYRTVYNLSSIKDWIELKKKRYELSDCNSEKLYGYDINIYGSEFDDHLQVEKLFDVLETYAKLYFIYVVESSLIVANYSIRPSGELLSKGNFPMYQDDLFVSNSEDDRYCHVLDFDTLRLGRKVIENNPNIGSFEFGVVVISEVGKERGNNLELKEVKRNEKGTNQKNDLFNTWLKMCRHAATVDNYPFIKVFTDEQRPESWGADARDLCEIVHIVSSGKQRIALPNYKIERSLIESLFNWFMKIYYQMRYLRGDNTLMIYCLKSIVSVLFKRHMRIVNDYGYSISNVAKEHGTMDGEVEEKRYYLMNKKIYARRFSTDCFSDYFNKLAKKTKVGLNDYVEYAGQKATLKELKLQNSYFINSLYSDDK